MAQFDVFPNPGRNRERIPYVLDVQSDLLRDLSTRVVVPLGVPEIVERQYLSALNPLFKVARRQVVMLSTEIAHLPSRLLVRPVGNLEAQRFDILRAIDAVLSGI